MHRQMDGYVNGCKDRQMIDREIRIYLQERQRQKRRERDLFQGTDCYHCGGWQVSDPQVDQQAEAQGGSNAVSWV